MLNKQVKDAIANLEMFIRGTDDTYEYFLWFAMGSLKRAMDISAQSHDKQCREQCAEREEWFKKEFERQEREYPKTTKCSCEMSSSGYCLKLVQVKKSQSSTSSRTFAPL